MFLGRVNSLFAQVLSLTAFRSARKLSSGLFKRQTFLVTYWFSDLLNADHKTLEMAPSNYAFNLQAMSREKMEFILPGVFTIGPKNDTQALEKFALLLGAEDHKKIDGIIEGVIEGETRVLAASMKIEEIFNGRDVFKATIISKVQDELDQFGMVIYNANVKELQDMQGSEYANFVCENL